MNKRLFNRDYSLINKSQNSLLLEFNLFIQLDKIIFFNLLN